MFEKLRRGWRGMMRKRDRREPGKAMVIPAERHGIDPRAVSRSARLTCERLRRGGYQAYVVGGAVRDLLLGLPPKDFDVATDATPSQIKRTQRRAFIIGRRFRLVHVKFGVETIECATFRSLDDSGVAKDESGRVISDNVFGEMWEDAARRDFTINAMFYDPLSGEVFDYHHGYEDLRERRLRVIGDPAERYREDPVRMMRAVRIAAKLGLTMEPETARAIPPLAPLLGNVPSSRLFDETVKLLTCGQAEKSLRELRRLGLYQSLLPTLDVILSEPRGESFLSLALRRTDERVAAGKKVSPAFLFATLLWPRVAGRWRAYRERDGKSPAEALLLAGREAIGEQAGRLAISARYLEDIRAIWLLQLRFERRAGRRPFALLEHPKYRAGFDFLILRASHGDVAESLVDWWRDFAAADEETRRAMVRQAEAEERRGGRAARREQPDAAPGETAEVAPRRPRRRRRKRRPAGQDGTPPAAGPA